MKHEISGVIGDDLSRYGVTLEGNSYFGAFATGVWRMGVGIPLGDKSKRSSCHEALMAVGYYDLENVYV